MRPGRLARATSILGLWQRLAEHNPVLLNPTFVENPVVDRLTPDLFVAVYDGATEGGIAYALSADGIDWGAEQVMRWASAPAWLKAPRTPLGLIHEQGNEYTMYFTAFDGLFPDGFTEPWWHNGFGNVGLARVRLAESKRASRLQCVPRLTCGCSLHPGLRRTFTVRRRSRQLR